MTTLESQVAAILSDMQRAVGEVAAPEGQPEDAGAPEVASILAQMQKSIGTAP